MEKITSKQFSEQLKKQTYFDSFENALDNGFMIIFKDKSGYALQVDTNEYEWIEARYITNAGITTGIEYYASR